jgi:hypothetical protein
VSQRGASWAVLDFDNSKAIVVLVYYRRILLHSHSDSLSPLQLQLQLQSQFTFTVASSHRCWVQSETTLTLWPGGKLNRRDIHVASVEWESHTSFVLSVSCCGKWTLFIILTNWFGSQENFFSNPRTVFPVLNVFLELPRAWIYQWLFPKKRNSRSDCINNWTGSALPETLLQKDSSAPLPCILGFDRSRWRNLFRGAYSCVVYNPSWVSRSRF